MKYIIFFCLISINCYSQKSKAFEIARSSNCVINGYIEYDENNAIIDTTYLVMGKDDRYPSLTEFIAIKSSEIDNIKSFLEACLQAFKQEEDGTSMQIDGSRVYVRKIYGMKTINVYGMGDDDNGYHGFNGAALSSLISSINKWKGKANK